jgi:hypothetical protein
VTLRIGPARMYRPRARLRQLLRGLADGREDVRGLHIGLLHAWPGAMTSLLGGGDFLAEYPLFTCRATPRERSRHA